MTFTHALSTNNYGTAKFIVSANAYEGTHTTIAAALTSASAGDTIFIRPGTYTENLTLKVGVNLTAFNGDGDTPNVTIIGKATLSTAGTVTISNIRLQTNSDFAIVVSGSVASILNLNNCYLNCSNNTGISYTSSSASSKITLNNCNGNLGTTGIAIYASSSAGTLIISHSKITNSGSSTTANTISAGALNYDYAEIYNPTTSSGTSTFGFINSLLKCVDINSTALTCGGSNNGNVSFCYFLSGTASAISVSTSLTVTSSTINSSNSNAITGAGTIQYANNAFDNSSSTINTTTQLPFTTVNGISRSSLQPAFLAISAGALNVTGDATTYTVVFGASEIFDQNNNFDGTSTFTSPVTGRYCLTSAVQVGDITSSHTGGNMTINTSNRNYLFYANNYANDRNSGNFVIACGSFLCDMDAGDTATVSIQVSNGTKVVDVLGTTSIFSGSLQF